MVVLEAAASPRHNKKKKNPPNAADSTSPAKKQRTETANQAAGGKKTPPAGGKSLKKPKRSIQFDESVKVREIALVPVEKQKKTTNKKDKLVKKIGEKLVGKKKKKVVGEKETGEKKPKKKGEKKEGEEKKSKKEEREKQKETKVARKKFKQQEDVFDIGVKAKKVWEEVSHKRSFKPRMCIQRKVHEILTYFLNLTKSITFHAKNIDTGTGYLVGP
jgi:hypothetical protein